MVFTEFVAQSGINIFNRDSEEIGTRAFYDVCKFESPPQYCLNVLSSQDLAYSQTFK